MGGLALVTSDAYTGSAATTFTLPDFEATLGPSARSAVGFRLPVLRAVRDTAATFPRLRVARDGRASELRARLTSLGPVPSGSGDRSRAIPV